MNTDRAAYYGYLLAAASRIARRAGAEIMRHHREGVAVEHKPDQSPVTAADRAAEEIIVTDLRALTPGVTIVAEEAIANGDTVGSCDERFWLVDPLDGTKEFAKRSAEFTVNIALIEGGRPVMGVVLAPALDLLYAGGENLGAHAEEAGTRRPVRCAASHDTGLTVVGSRSHGDDTAMEAFLTGCQVTRHVKAGSSLKFCIVAHGAADLYPRLGRTMEWDTAAGHAVLRAAGGDVWSLVDGRRLSYGKPAFANPHFVAAALPPPPVLRERLNLET